MVEGDDMAQHLNHFRELANQLRSLSEDGKGMDDTELVTILTLSLPQSYEPLVMALQSRSDTVTESTIIATIHCSDVGYCLFRNPLVMHIPYHVPSLLL